MKETNKNSKKIIIEPKNSNLKKNDTSQKKIKKLTLHTLVSSKENKKSKKRVGRGAGSKRGKTSTFGHKGQRSRSGHKIGSKFEGGQMPFYRRIPKLRGFKQHNSLVYQVVNLKDINDRNIINVTNQTLFDANLIRSLKGNVKILGEGEIKHKISVEVSSISESARIKILALSGEIKLI